MQHVFHKLRRKWKGGVSGGGGGGEGELFDC